MTMRCLSAIAMPLALLPCMAAADDAPPPPPSSGCATPYPLTAIRLHHQGITDLQFLIEPDGSVKDVTVYKSSGHSELDEAAVKSAACWHYKPAMRDGKPVETPWRADVNWHMSG